MPRSSGWSTSPCSTTPVSEGNAKSLKRAPFRAWLVTGPAGRLVGFILDFAKALKAHRQATKASR